MKPFLLLAIRAEDAAADNEYDSFLTLAGLHTLVELATPIVNSGNDPI